MSTVEGGVMYLKGLGIAAVLLCTAQDSGAGQAQHDADEGGLRMAAFQPMLEYRGSYRCNQGVTALTLWIAGDAAVFSFHAHPDNPGVASGAFSMQGRVDLAGGVLHLRAAQWIDQPTDWLMVDLDGVSYDGGLSFQGKVTGPNCSSFSVARGQNRDRPPAAR